MKEDMELKTLGMESGIVVMDLHGQFAVVVVAEQAKTAPDALAAARRLFDALPADEAVPHLWKTADGQAYVGPVEFVINRYANQPAKGTAPPHLAVVHKEGDKT